MSADILFSVSEFMDDPVNMCKVCPSDEIKKICRKNLFDEIHTFEFVKDKYDPYIRQEEYKTVRSVATNFTERGIHRFNGVIYTKKRKIRRRRR